MPSCSSIVCPGREGILRCTRCRDAQPPTLYCSQDCQIDDWASHKSYCGKLAYVFSVELLGSADPTTTRRVAILSWFTFQQFHFTLQYIFGPWQNCHLHIFNFVEKAWRMAGSFDPRPRSLLKIVPPDEDEEHGEDERTVTLADVYASNAGALRNKVMLNGTVAPLVYEYDFGDCWEHKITFQGSELARAVKPLVKSAVGCAPVEDCGGIHGWNELREAFLAARPTVEQLSRIAWAKNRSGLGQGYTPHAPVSVTQLNYEGRWENHYQNYVETERQCVGY